MDVQAGRLATILDTQDGTITCHAPWHMSPSTSPTDKDGFTMGRWLTAAGESLISVLAVTSNLPSVSTVPCQAARTVA